MARIRLDGGLICISGPFFRSEGGFVSGANCSQTVNHITSAEESMLSRRCPSPSKGNGRFRALRDRS